MTSYEFSGRIEVGREKQPFTRQVEAETKKHAEDKLYAELGSEHELSRSRIEIKEVEEV